MAFFISQNPQLLKVLLLSYTAMIASCALVLLLQFTIDLKLMHSSGEAGRDFPAAFFSNPNNLATFIVVSVPLIHWLAKTTQQNGLFRINLILIALMLLAMMSRTALALFALYPLMYSVLFSKNPAYLLLPALAVIAALLFINSSAFEQMLVDLMSSRTEFIARSAERLWMALYNLSGDSSVGYRSQIYELAFPKLLSIFEGYGSREYGGFFAGDIVNPLAYKNPHSYVIEIALAYSSFAFLCLMGLLALMGLTSLYFWGVASRFWLISAAFFLAGGFIPSTILRMQMVWLPMFMLFFACLPKAVTAEQTKPNTPHP